MLLLKVNWCHALNPIVWGEMVCSTPIRIGRDWSNEIILADSNGGVSQRHAVVDLAYNEGQSRITLEDLNSSNGTWLNGTRISHTEIEPDLPIVIGIYVLTVHKLIRCQKESCQRVFAYEEKMCPWCGQFTTDARTATFFEGYRSPVATG